MKQKSILIVCLFLLAGLVSACAGKSTATPAPDLQPQAEAALRDFYGSLNSADYAKAETLYGGSYELLQNMNPVVDPNDHLTLFTNGCTMNGFQCLKVMDVSLKEQKSATEFVFTVKFQNADGSPFIQGPCCGQTEAESPSKPTFDITVSQNAAGQFVVMDMPPYVP